MGNLEEIIKGMERIIGEAKENCDKFIKGNNVAGTRARKNFQDIKGLAQNGRSIITGMRYNSQSKG